MTAKTTASLSEVLRVAIESYIDGLHIAMPCRVLSYDVLTQTAELQPELKRPVQKIDGTVTEEALSPIPNVPVAFPRAGSWFLSMPVTVGDKMFVIFNSRSLEEWRSLGADVLPNDRRPHPLDGAVAIPANLYPTASALTTVESDHMVIGNDLLSKIYVKNDGEIHLAQNNPAEYVALATKTLTELTSLQTQINAIVTVMNANAAIFTAHTHPGVTPGPGVTGTPAGGFSPATTVTAPNSVASAKVKSL